MLVRMSPSIRWLLLRTNHRAIAVTRFVTPTAALNRIALPISVSGGLGTQPCFAHRSIHCANSVMRFGFARNTTPMTIKAIPSPSHPGNSGFFGLGGAKHFSEGLAGCGDMGHTWAL